LCRDGSVSGNPAAIDADWLRAPALRRVFAALTAEGDEARVIGGAVRNALIGVPVTDIDIATTATPDRVLRLAAAAGLKTAPTGLAHGTVTVIADHRPVEVTTLREDVETDGRRAVVRFTTDWTADALRRDFTINAMSATLDGRIFDPVGGIADCAATLHMRFGGDKAYKDEADEASRKALDLRTEPGESIVLYAVGAAGYYCDLYVYDMYGLTSREAADAAQAVIRMANTRMAGAIRMVSLSLGVDPSCQRDDESGGASADIDSFLPPSEVA